MSLPSGRMIRRLWYALIFVLINFFLASDGLVVCDKSEITFYHIPKTGGSSVTTLLKPKCTVLWGPMHNNNSIWDKWDSAHINYMELREGLKEENLYPNINVSQAMNYKSFAVVRNPYIRFLSSYHQRFQIPFMHGMYNRWWNCITSKCPYTIPNDRHKSLEIFTIWLHNVAMNGTLQWQRDWDLVHFRPSTVYTHNVANKPALQIVDHVVKVENMDTELPKLFASLFPNGPDSFKVPHTNSKYIHKEDIVPKNLCNSETGCRQDELERLIQVTRHTPLTIKLVTDIYRADFELLGYNKLIVTV